MKRLLGGDMIQEKVIVGEVVIDDPDLIPPGTDPRRHSWVPLGKYEELMEKFRTINYEYTKLSNAWMGFASQNRIRPEEVRYAEGRGKEIFDIATKLLPFDPIKLTVLETLIKVLTARGFKAWVLRTIL